MEIKMVDAWRSTPRHLGKAFISDGIIEAPRWKRAPRRVLFLLKEAYDDSESQSGFDLCERLRNGPTWRRKATIRNLGRWAHLIHEFSPGDIPSFPDNDAADAAILASALVNVKKSGGSSRSVESDILDYARSDRALLLEQIRGIRPDVIVLGGTWGAAKELWPALGHVPSEVIVSYRCHRTDLAPLIHFWHPGAHRPKRLLYYGMAGMLQAASTQPFLPEPRDLA